MTLADERGIFRMVAVDQRPPLFQALARHGDRTPEQVTYDEVAAVKTLLTRMLAPAASAILIDPVWTHPHALHQVPGRVGLLSTLEDHNFRLENGERWSYSIPGWSVAKIKRSGAAGVKVLAWHRPDLRDDTQEHQDAFVAGVGEACREQDIPFILELLTYPKPGEDVGGTEYARAKPHRVLESVRHYADERFGVDLLKLEFPADLKFTREFASGAFDGISRRPGYDLAEVKGYLADLSDITNVPWVLLSAGVGQLEFSLDLELACEAGASGFLAGRAVWLEALERYPDMAAVEARLAAASLPYLRRISAMAETATPWWDHRRYGGVAALQGAAPEWYREYPG